MKQNPGLKMGKEGRRLETQKQQRLAAGKGVYPRRLARGIAKEIGGKAGWRENIRAYVLLANKNGKGRKKK